MKDDISKIVPLSSSSLVIRHCWRPYIAGDPEDSIFNQLIACEGLRYMAPFKLDYAKRNLTALHESISMKQIVILIAVG